MISFQKEFELYQKSISKFGKAEIVDLAIEEMAELIVELKHDRRERDCDVEQEIADVMIMTNKLRLIFDTQKVDRIKQEKLERVKGMVE